MSPLALIKEAELKGVGKGNTIFSIMQRNFEKYTNLEQIKLMAYAFQAPRAARTASRHRLAAWRGAGTSMHGMYGAVQIWGQEVCLFWKTFRIFAPL